ncbi:flavin oxidoreductase [Mycobacterium dioxanotrophicus]|uniref:Flavin oxidoreductase n=1 Tax=Mycobacterium dioxanotrophicus TaxID=482462 RepID=A0A1Y0C6V7_9MYCO|nr:flavin reductase family protein [Mycobacterium dioxanotrophicus]ART70796.1 flavin oxidoreductase [Mycobacterium dioxanotrophicus]
MTAMIEQTHYRTVMGHLPTGVVAVSAILPDTAQPWGMIVGTFQSLSLGPALVSFSVAHTSTSWPRLRTAGQLCASVLGVGQKDVCKALSGKNPDKFAYVDWRLSPGGSPRVTGAHAWIDCQVVHEFDGGDHVIVVAEVTAMDGGDGEPLVFHKGQLGGYRQPIAV